ncbi:hypothetical protein [Anabaena azotica]|uniref:Uncharacterized protein n=1 Tax=Anabaena azotica FACHB-119 TaxID=947527 RepID=A0ABR8DCF4_9NOST|nr:hypothetical protein [Anabaena azotica]MBD2504648.1 hypothetical protein [Anabaena azotica FACHB-119]
MLGLTLEETRVYREAKAEAEEEILKAVVPLLLKTGMSIEQIAQQLNVDLETIRFAAQQNKDE